MYWELSAVCRRIFSIFYGFRDKLDRNRPKSANFQNFKGFAFSSYLNVVFAKFLHITCVYYWHKYWLKESLILLDCLKPISMEIFEDNFLLCGFAPGFVNTKKGCTRLAAASDKSLPVACPWSVVLTRYSGFFHH